MACKMLGSLTNDNILVPVILSSLWLNYAQILQDLMLDLHNKFTCLTAK